jgi:hypothetical protein
MSTAATTLTDGQILTMIDGALDGLFEQFDSSAVTVERLRDLGESDLAAWYLDWMEQGEEVRADLVEMRAEQAVEQAGEVDG